MGLPGRSLHPHSVEIPLEIVSLLGCHRQRTESE